MKSLTSFKDEIDPSKIGLFGGSHGGTIGTLLCGHKDY